MFKRKRFPALAALILAGIFAFQTFASTQDEINTVRQEQQETEYKMISTKERLSALSAEKGNAESYLTELTAQLESLADRLLDLQNRYDEKQTELGKTKAELEEAETIRRGQYDDMKLRIQYLYESGTGAGVLEALFSGESFTEFLNKSEGINQLTKFDREMLAEYEAVCEDIKEHESRIIVEQEEILALKSECDEQRAQINEIYESVYRDMQECIASINDAENEMNALAEKLAMQDERLQNLLIRSYEEEAARRAAEEAAARKAAEEAAAEAENPGTEASQEEIKAGETVPDAQEEPEPQTESVEEAPSQKEEQPSSGNLSYLGSFTLTAYCPCSKCCGKWASGYTASGTYATPNRTVAMAGVPFGTRLMINGQIYTVEDRGTPYGWVDIFFASHDEALRFGMRSADVYLVN